LLADADGPRVAIAAHQVADEEVAAAEVDAVLIDTDPEVHPLLEQRALLVGRARGELTEPIQGRTARELPDEVSLRVGDHVRVADRSAPLRHDGGDPRPGQDDADGPAVDDGVLDDESVAARRARRRRHAADDGDL